MLHDLRTMQPVEGQERVMVPGDPERYAYEERIEKGIPIHPEVLDDLHDVARRTGVRALF
jgi:LDH2 family malate/lactate/ureidoglycolate dehydrogenase